jgi:hypothetical protein
LLLPLSLQIPLFPNKNPSIRGLTLNKMPNGYKHFLHPLYYTGP